MSDSPSAVDAKPREVSPSDLERVLSEHQEWLRSDGVTGERAEFHRVRLAGVDFSRANLRRVSFAGSDLAGAKLDGADLSGAELGGANLCGASLRAANLHGADLDETILRDSDLRDADLLEARGLAGGQLGGADVAGAKLPEAITKFEGLASVQETSKSSASLFTSTLLLCAYTWLTILATRDAQLLNNAAPPSSRLPILGTDIPLIQFYLVCPLLLFCFYIYFHLCLQRLWEELADLPAVFPDGRPLDAKAHPWMLNSLVCLHVGRLRRARPALTLWQARLAALVAWGIVPFTLVLLWVRYLTGHDWRVTGAHIALIALALGAGLGFYRLAIQTLRGAARPSFSWSRPWQDVRLIHGFVALAVFAVLFVISLGAIDGVNANLVRKEISQDYAKRSALDPRVWVPRSLDLVGVRSFAALDGIDLSTKPSNWSGKETDLSLVKGADLAARDLRFADAYGAFFVNGFLKGADLRGADLREADFRNADLRRADLSGANLRGAKLQNADLSGAILNRAVLTQANLTNADLSGTDLSDTRITQADLTNADLTNANLQRADLSEAKLVNTTLVSVKMRDAILERADLTGAKLAPPVELSGGKHSDLTRRTSPATAVEARPPGQP